MHPICFHLRPDYPIHWFGVLVAVGFLLATLHWNLLGRRAQYPPGFGSDLAFWTIIAGIVGARLAYVAANASDYVAHPLEMIRIDEGGLIFYGGFIGAVAAVVLLARRRGRGVWDLGDFAITGVPLGHAFGRLGCFMNGCCAGATTGAPFGVQFPRESGPWYDQLQAQLIGPTAERALAVHPVQLYEAGLNVLLYAVLLYAFLHRRRAGDVVALYLLTYPVGRFLLEFVRGDARMAFGPLNVAQVVSLALLAAGAWLAFAVRDRRPAVAAAEPATEAE